MIPALYCSPRLYAGQLPALWNFGPVTIATVSYTHLRAHETVLDLVCRLLLEKKIPNTTYT